MPAQVRFRDDLGEGRWSFAWLGLTGVKKLDGGRVGLPFSVFSLGDARIPGLPESWLPVTRRPPLRDNFCIVDKEIWLTHRFDTDSLFVSTSGGFWLIFFAPRPSRLGAKKFNQNPPEVETEHENKLPHGSPGQISLSTMQ